MRALAVFRDPMPRMRADAIARIEADIGAFNVGFMPGSEPAFDPDRPENRSAVALRVRAFACNYRDKVLLSGFLRAAGGAPFQFIGSDFVADVVGTGKHVREVEMGDRVVGNNHYAPALARGAAVGIPTNHASRGFFQLHELQVVKVPPGVPDPEAASFSVCAQTCYSIMRRLDPRPGQLGLVTAATSSTSLGVLRALRERGVEVYAASTTLAKSRDLSGFGVSATLRLGSPGELSSHELLRTVRRRRGGFDFVVDPFGDLYLPEVLEFLADGGRYVTCGFLNQAGIGADPQAFALPLLPFLETLISRNLSVLGNCLGSRDDLERALADRAAGRFGLPVDSVYSGGSAGEFMQRSFFSSERLGRVVYAF